MAKSQKTVLWFCQHPLTSVTESETQADTLISRVWTPSTVDKHNTPPSCRTEIDGDICFWVNTKLLKWSGSWSHRPKQYILSNLGAQECIVWQPALLCGDFPSPAAGSLGNYHAESEGVFLKDEHIFCDSALNVQQHNEKCYLWLWDVGEVRLLFYTVKTEIHWKSAVITRSFLLCNQEFSFSRIFIPYILFIGYFIILNFPLFFILDAFSTTLTCWHCNGGANHAHSKINITTTTMYCYCAVSQDKTVQPNWKLRCLCFFLHRIFVACSPGAAFVFARTVTEPVSDSWFTCWWNLGKHWRRLTGKQLLAGRPQWTLLFEVWF